MSGDKYVQIQVGDIVLASSHEDIPHVVVDVLGNSISAGAVISDDTGESRVGLPGTMHGRMKVVGRMAVTDIVDLMNKSGLDMDFGARQKMIDALTENQSKSAAVIPKLD